MSSKVRINDLREMNASQPIEVDVCIVGAGPAGLSIATELAGTHLSVLVLESGVKGHETEFAVALDKIESIGEPRIMEPHKVRNRAVGGSSLTWSGRCRPLNAIDYEHRTWIPGSGWPVTEEEMAPFVERSLHYLGLQSLDCDDESLDSHDRDLATLGLRSKELRSIFWQFSRGPGIGGNYVHFGQEFQKLKSSNVQLLTNATVSEIVTSRDGSHIQDIRVLTPDRTAYKVRSGLTVLCGGGIENARILLLSRRYDPKGIGNQFDLVGRFLMDHPRTTVGHFSSESQVAIQKYFGLQRHASQAVLQRGVALRPEFQQREHLLNGAAWTTQHVADDDVWRALRSLLRNTGSNRVAQSRHVLRNSDQLLSGLWNRLLRGRPLPRRMGRLDMDVMVEQTPDSDSRITLGIRTDALDMPLARIDWKIGQMERRTAIALGKTFNAALKCAGLPQAELVDWVRRNRPEDAVFEDMAHPIGATRMSTYPSQGVVDHNGRVFGIDNLYIAGSSVFPTAGHANPTLMIVAMALRMADYIRAFASSASALHMASVAPPTVCAPKSVETLARADQTLAAREMQESGDRLLTPRTASYNAQVTFIDSLEEMSVQSHRGPGAAQDENP